MSTEEQKNKTQILRETLSSALQEALSEAGEEILLNRWVLVGDLFIDGERTILPIWGENMDALEIESLLAPPYRMAQRITDMYTVGVPSEALEFLGQVDDEDDDEDD